ncbi:hypothetical protein PV10_07092 [Exophiala mesophila]|uniref:Myb-like domain-containing protein n=1 Tax=Exophiala mesophila TaxID=212818 RepID=A0A0D1Z4J7_EXOME|nr:uncharacterized protein PV10_07092 [Exophiala mesophila]KIV89712.1 hypothetical protein PV10_07092 [Exophiala mesophila]
MALADSSLGELLPPETAVQWTETGLRIIPFEENMVFRYLDNHPEALNTYLYERPNVFDSILRNHSNTQIQSPRPTVEALPNYAQFMGMDDPQLSNLGLFGGESMGYNEQEFWIASDGVGGDEGVFIPNAALEQGTLASPIPSFDNSSESEVESIASPENARTEEVISSLEPIASQNTFVAEAFISSRESSLSPAIISSDESESEYEDEDSDFPPSPRKRTAVTTTPKGNTESGNQAIDPFIPYPAPAHLIEASRNEPAQKKWRLFEEDACIKHMLDIRDEGVLRGEARFAEAQRRMKDFDGVEKPATHAVKNFWNRYGRARSGYDERKIKSDVLATSQQAKGYKRKAAMLRKQRRDKATGEAHQSSPVIKKRKNDNSDTDSDDSQDEYRPSASIKRLCTEA